MITVLMVTYNHEAFIEKAIAGVMRQKTSFPLQLIIGDDASTDETQKVIESLVPIYYDRIIYIRNVTNLGMLSNFANIFSIAGTKYFAMCDGDDYWCDDNKLQKQIDFLEANPGYSMCFHQVYELKKDVLSLSNLVGFESEKTFTVVDLGLKNLIYTSSVVIRKSSLPADFPSQDFLKLAAGDYPIFLLAAKNGKAKFLPEPMSVYRRHSGGVWSKLHSIRRFEKWLSVLEYLLKQDFSNEVRNGLQKQAQYCREKILKGLMNEYDWKEFLDKLAAYSANDSYIANKWLLEYYPAYISSYTSSKIYRLVTPIRIFFTRMKRRIKNS